MQVVVLTENELRQVVKVDSASVAAIEDAFTQLAGGQVSMPPIMHIEIPEHNGDVDIKSAYVPGLDRFAVKIGAGFFNNDKIGLPNSPAMMVVISARTGMVEAVLLDNAFLTDVRTGAAGAVASRHLAPSHIETAGVIGAGVQGRFQVLGLKTVRSFERLLVYDHDEKRLGMYVDEMGKMLDVEVIAAAGAEAVFRESQAVITSTPSRQPYVRASWLHPGLHITAMGADLPEKQELEADVFRAVDIVVCDRKAQSFKMGELHHALDAGILDQGRVIELGEITSGMKTGRRSEGQITVCDLTGTGVQDTAIANLALEKAIENDMGIKINMGI